MDNKQYLISFVATIQGGQMAVSQLTQMEQTTGKLDKGMVKAGKSANNFARMLKRSAMIIPLWFALRRVFMGVMNTIGDMIGSWAKFDDAMARVKTVVSASSKSVEADMLAIRRTILDTAKTTRMSLGELSETMYFLRTASLTTEEAIAAFQPTVNAMVGTMNKGKDTARAMAGMYNTMGKYLGDNLTVHEKFQKISDVLTYTYATQDVQLDELTAGYMKLAPYLSGLDDSFEGIIATLGFLNTRLLRSGRTGRLVGRSILQLTKNADKLAESFGITFDPDQPINFLKTMRQIREGMNKTGKLTAKQGEMLREVFATRGAVPVRLLIEHFEELVETIENTIDGAGDFAEMIRRIRENTVPAQMERYKNILRVITIDFMVGALSAGDMASAMQEFNDSLAEMKVEKAGRFVGWFNQQASKLALNLIAFNKLDWASILVGDIEEGGKVIEKFWEGIAKGKIQFESFAEFNKKLTEEAKKQKKLREEEAKARDALTKKQEDIAEAEKKERIAWSRLNQELKHRIKLMDILGVHELDIARFRLETLQTTDAMVSNEKLLEEQTKARLAYEEAGLNYRKELVNVLFRAQIDMARAQGMNELQILEIQKKQLNALEGQIGVREMASRQQEIQNKRALEHTKLLRKQLSNISDMSVEYGKLEPSEKPMFGEMMDMVEMTSEELYKLMKDPKLGKYGAVVAEKFWGNFKREQRDRMTDAFAELRRGRWGAKIARELTYKQERRGEPAWEYRGDKWLRERKELEEIPLEKIPTEKLEKFLDTTPVVKFWTIYGDEGVKAVERVGKKYREIMSEIWFPGLTAEMEKILTAGLQAPERLKAPKEFPTYPSMIPREWGVSAEAPLTLRGTPELFAPKGLILREKAEDKAIVKKIAKVEIPFEIVVYERLGDKFSVMTKEAIKDAVEKDPAFKEFLSTRL